MGFTHGAQQAGGDHAEDIPLPGRQGLEVGIGDLRRGNDGVVVGHLAAVHHSGGFHRERLTLHEGECLGHGGTQHRQALRHILRQIPAVRPWVSCQPFFIEALEIIKGLLGGVVEQTVGFPLECSQVIELWRALGVLLPFHGPHNGGPAQAGGPQRFCVRLGIEFAADGAKRPQIQLHCVEFFLLEAPNSGLPLCQQREGRRHHPAHVQRLTFINAGEQPGPVDTNEPVRLGAA